MNIPRAWFKASADGRFADGRTLPVTVWGWGDDEAGARKGAVDRLQRVLDRIRRGESFPDPYGYGSRPPREEILRTIDGAMSDTPVAMVTRNRYGAQVLNAAHLLFLDIDVQPASIANRVLRLFGGMSPEEAALAKLRDALRRYGRATFRIYRTAAGLRVMAIDRDFDPADRDVAELMTATGTDPAFTRLCLAQRSFRARLTPKPWRCGSSLPPGQHPRPDGEARRSFAAWLTDYETCSMRYSTCRYLETIGGSSAKASAKLLLELHDKTTRCDEALPLA